MLSSGVFLEDKVTTTRVQPAYAIPSLNYEITGNRGKRLAQDIHQSRRNRRAKRRIARRAESPTWVNRSPPPPSPSINTRHYEEPPSIRQHSRRPTSRAPEVVAALG
ncbi:hypothetical protein F511_21914 [Dorcoceras hygrometricum]|uniref:Uncharacterized protein n=1 Tax=Dorcoceras hygrometricum TaxID=472368 RepID=A0A2Z7AUZ3_9LAMI|nr:hypothetical protein F511_21914 [Dorcoceras hygrometricum]